MTENVKIVIIGDGGVGKTCLKITYENKSFPGDYIPTVFSNYNMTILYNNKHVSLGIWDTAGQSDYDRLRPLSYPETNVFIICFSIDNHESLQNVKDKWIPEISEHGHSDTPTILVATKIDLRDDEEALKKLSEKCLKPITPEEGKSVKDELKIHKYCETSAKKMKGVEEAFLFAVDAVLGEPDMKSSKKDEKCLVM